MEIAQLFVIFLVSMLAGVPVGVAMLLASIVNVTLFGIPQTIIAERMLNSINSFTLLAVPFYIVWKIPLYVGFLVKREKTWIRTERVP